MKSTQAAQNTYTNMENDPITTYIKKAMMKIHKTYATQRAFCLSYPSVIRADLSQTASDFWEAPPV